MKPEVRIAFSRTCATVGRFAVRLRAFLGQASRMRKLPGAGGKNGEIRDRGVSSPPPRKLTHPARLFLVWLRRSESEAALFKRNPRAETGELLFHASVNGRSAGMRERGLGDSATFATYEPWVPILFKISSIQSSRANSCRRREKL